VICSLDGVSRDAVLSSQGAHRIPRGTCVRSSLHCIGLTRSYYWVRGVLNREGKELKEKERGRWGEVFRVHFDIR